MTKRAVLLKALASMPSDVERMARGLDSAEAPDHPAKDEKPIAVFLSHLRDFEERYRAQLERVIQEDRPTLTGLRHHAVHLDLDAPFQDLVERFITAREDTLGFLNGLSRGDWQRKAVHETLGDTNLRFLVQNLMEYDTQHLSQLVQICQGHQVPLSLDLPSLSSIRLANPTPAKEVKRERQRTRKWPRKRARRGN